MAISGTPSSLKSPVARDCGAAPAASVNRASAANVPSPTPGSTETSDDPEFAVRRSASPSPSKSAAANATGSVPTA